MGRVELVGEVKRKKEERHTRVTIRRQSILKAVVTSRDLGAAGRSFKDLDRLLFLK